MSKDTTATVKILPQEAHTFAVSILTASGVPSDRANLVADGLVLADLRGVDTHGINRLAGYIARIRHGVLDPNPSLSFVQKKGWALDADGKNTTDPAEALKGVVLPIGGPKGSGLALMMDVFGGLLTGSAFGGGVIDQYKDLDKRQGVGHWFMVFRPEMFLDSREEYLERMDTLLERVRGCEKAAGVEQIFTPGEIEELKEKIQRDEGIPFTKGEIEALHELADNVGCKSRLTDTFS
ncbi:hypothetical protein M8818_005872 [Zalaria obscura]|uniref:Uncharacterized protein n=1 Tax=Zalaria obscura TaxID=2024903 RepID=A0ACC3S9J4_9PEZI